MEFDDILDETELKGLEGYFSDVDNNLTDLKQLEEYLNNIDKDLDIYDDNIYRLNILKNIFESECKKEYTDFDKIDEKLNYNINLCYTTALVNLSTFVASIINNDLYSEHLRAYSLAITLPILTFVVRNYYKTVKDSKNLEKDLNLELDKLESIYHQLYDNMYMKEATTTEREKVKSRINKIKGI